MISHGNDDDSLIGYDPLAWMQEVNNEVLQNSDESAVFSSDNLTKLETESPLNDSESELQESENLANNIITLEANQTIQNITALHERLAFALESGEKLILMLQV